MTNPSTFRMPGQDTRATRHDLPGLLRSRETFAGQSLSAGPPVGYAGQLTSDERANYMAGLLNGRITWELRSFTTPIAWQMVDPHQLHIVKQNLSPTTSRHQDLARAYLL